MSSLQRLGITVLVTIVAIYGIYRFGYGKGWGERDAEMQAQIAAKNESERRLEQKLSEQVTANATKLQELNNVVAEKQSALNRAISAGRVRLPAPSCVQASPSAPSPAGDRNETRSQPDRPADQSADSERATLAAIAEIVAQGDRNTQQLNACIDAYNLVREQLNGNR